MKQELTMKCGHTNAKLDDYGNCMTCEEVEWRADAIAQKKAAEDEEKDAIVATHNLEDLEHKTELLQWQKLGLSYTASGYGRKIPTQHMIKLPGSNRWRRVYCCIYSNIGTCYVTTPSGGWIVIN